MRLNERVVDSNDVDVLVLHAIPPSALAHRRRSGGLYVRIAEDDTTNAAEAVDTDLHLVNQCSYCLSPRMRAP